MRTLGPLLLFCLGLAAVPLLRQEAARLEVRDEEDAEQLYLLPPATWLPVAALGHDEALADLIWCRAQLYLGEEFLARRSLRYVFEYTEAMLALDPDFVAVYEWIGTAGVYSPVGIDTSDIEHAVEVMERGRQRFPLDGHLAWILGATLSFELAPQLPAGPAREDAQLRGAEQMLAAQRLGAAPDWTILATTAQFDRIGSAERATAALEEMYASVSDERVRDEIAMRIADIRSDAYGAAFAEANDDFERERLRRFPYVHPSLYFLIAPSIDERDDPLREGYGRALIRSVSPQEAQ